MTCLLCPHLMITRGFTFSYSLTMEMKILHQNYYSTEDEDTLFAKENEMELERQCNGVTPSYK